MTREEAIDNLEELWHEVYNEDSDGYDYAVAIDMAIEALQDEAVQSCDGCIYNTRIPQEQCLRCKRYWRDSYERKGGDDE